MVRRKEPLCVITFLFHIAPFSRHAERNLTSKKRGDAMEVIKSNSFFVCLLPLLPKQATNTLNRLVYFVLHSRKEFVQQNLHRKKVFLGEFFLLHCCCLGRSVYIRFILNYFLWPFAIIKKALLSLLFIRLACFFC